MSSRAPRRRGAASACASQKPSSGEPVVKHNLQRHRSDLGSCHPHGSGRFGPRAPAPQEAARCATRRPHAQGYRRRTRLDHLDVMEWSAGPGARWLPTTIQDVVSCRADVANNLRIARPLLIQKQTKPSVSGDRLNEHLAVIELRRGCLACNRRFIPKAVIGPSTVDEVIRTLADVRTWRCFGRWKRLDERPPSSHAEGSKSLMTGRS